MYKICVRQLTTFEKLVDAQLQQEYGVVERFVIGAFLLASAKAIVDRHLSLITLVMMKIYIELKVNYKVVNS
jgi:hypothetical protein